MRRHLSVCVEPGCQELTRSDRCPRHQRSKDRAIKRRTAAQRQVYSSPRWRGLRRQVLREQPFCAVEGCLRPSADVDHIVPVAWDDSRAFDRDNLQGLCTPHHSAKTAREVWGRT